LAKNNGVVDIVETPQMNPYEQAWAQRIAELQAQLAPLKHQAAELWAYSILSLPLQTHVWFWNAGLLQTCVLIFMYGRLVPLQDQMQGRSKIYKVVGKHDAFKSCWGVGGTYQIGKYFC
jgi:hypothetical protein